MTFVVFYLLLGLLAGFLDAWFLKRHNAVVSKNELYRTLIGVLLGPVALYMVLFATYRTFNDTKHVNKDTTR